MQLIRTKRGVSVSRGDSIMKDYLRRTGDLISGRKLFSSNERKTVEEILETKGMNFCGSVISDIGCVRLTNEDNYVMYKYMNVDLKEHSEVSVFLPKASGEWRFAGVFDGMGGGEMGELAARDSAEIFLRVFCGIGRDMPKAEVDSIMRKAFLKANNKVIDLQQKYGVFGTTGTVVGSNGLEFKIYHLGDSRAYLFRENDLFQITKDQTLAQLKIDSGIYRRGDPIADSDKHKLTEYIGRDWTRENIRPVESHWIPIQPNDNILLCSDGLYDMCTDEEITGILRKDTAIEEKCAMLINRARERGGEDNITGILILFGG